MVDVRVATHFNEDAFSHGLALGLANRLRAGLADLECAEHSEEPVIELSTEGIAQTVNDIRIEIIACCDPLRDRVEQVVADALDST